jgi:hypothetical protein
MCRGCIPRPGTSQSLYLERVEGEEAPCAEVVSHGQGHHTRTVVQGCHLHLLQRKLNLNDDEQSLKLRKNSLTK